MAKLLTVLWLERSCPQRCQMYYSKENIFTKTNNYTQRLGFELPTVPPGSLRSIASAAASGADNKIS